MTADRTSAEFSSLTGNLPLQYTDGPDFCTVKDATGGDFALTVQPELMQMMERALLDREHAQRLEDSADEAYEKHAKKIFGMHNPRTIDSITHFYAGWNAATACRTPAVTESEARQMVIEANNSLYGSRGYFHSLDGGPFNKYHLAEGIEKLKADNNRLYGLVESLRASLTSCRTSYCGYAITKPDEQYPKVLADFWREIQRIDKIARDALPDSSTLPETGK